MSGDALGVVIGWTAVHYLWIGLLLGAMVYLSRTLLAAATPRCRIRTLSVGLYLLGATPIALGWFLFQQLQSPPPDLSGDALGGAALPSVTAAGTSVAGTPTPDARPPGPMLSPAAARLVHQTVPVVWVIGALLLTGVVGIGLWRVRQWRRRLASTVEEAWPLQELLRELHWSRKVGLRICSRAHQPWVCGVWQPWIVIPATTPDLSRRQREMVLLHELHHVDQRDNLRNLLHRTLEALLFFQPAVWCTTRWIREEQEKASDDFVLAHRSAPADYAEALLSFTSVRNHPPLAAALGSPRVSARIRRILAEGESPMRRSHRFLALSGLVGASLLLCAMVPQARPAVMDDDDAVPSVCKKAMRSSPTTTCMSCHLPAVPVAHPRGARLWNLKAHDLAACAKCHVIDQSWAQRLWQGPVSVQDCTACHVEPWVTQTRKASQKTRCTDCHTGVPDQPSPHSIDVQAWRMTSPHKAPSFFDHRSKRVPAPSMCPGCAPPKKAKEKVRKKKRTVL